MPLTRKLLLECYDSAIRAVRGRERVYDFLQRHPLRDACRVVAIGKAAESMALGAIDVCGPRIEAGLIVTKHGYLSPDTRLDERFLCMESGHPLPDERSLEAGRRLLALIEAAPANQPLLFLISGGASSLVEVLPPGVGLADLSRVNDWLLASGWDIERINRVRKSLSCIKGGRLAARLGQRPATALLISDVPGNDPATIGSGLLGLPESGYSDPELPLWVRQLLERAPPPAAAIGEVHTEVIATLSDAMEAAGEQARQLGYQVHMHGPMLAGDAADAGQSLATQLLDSDRGVHVWGGETTLRLPPSPGSGGRCQHLALAAARKLVDVPGVALLAIATDGSDGPGCDAGALIDGQTIARGMQAGLDPERCLIEADSGSFLEASGDLVQTGPTGTNVTDLVIAVKG